MTMADVVVVMGEGRVQQVGPPLEVYHRPKNRFVADFIGANNFLDAEVVGGDRIRVLGRSLAAEVPAGLEPGAGAVLSIRPEKLRLFEEPPTDAPSFEGTVTFVRDLGQLVETLVEVGGRELRVVGAPPLAVGRRVHVGLEPADGVVFPR